MQSYYEINVSRNGRHFFATAPQSIVDRGTAKSVFEQIQARFPKSEGYECSVCFWEVIGYPITLDGEGFLNV